jgi:protein-S-isoprenylcysteine O-methyltransferase Ste14
MTSPLRALIRAADLPPVWLFFCALLVWALARWAPVVDLSHPALEWAGRALIAAGLVVMLWSAMWFNRLGTPIIPRRKPTALIAEGPYRLSRNPIYLADLALLIGWWMIFAPLSGIVAPPLFWWIVTRRFIEPEEDMLRQVFGAEAEAYFARVRRWI